MTSLLYFLLHVLSLLVLLLLLPYNFILAVLYPSVSSINFFLGLLVHSFLPPLCHSPYFSFLVSLRPCRFPSFLHCFLHSFHASLLVLVVIFSLPPLLTFFFVSIPPSFFSFLFCVFLSFHVSCILSLCIFILFFYMPSFFLVSFPGLCPSLFCYLGYFFLPLSFFQFPYL